VVRLDTEKCTGCGGRIDLCPQITIAMISDVVTVNEESCNECKICIKVCPMRAPYASEHWESFPIKKKSHSQSREVKSHV